MIKIRSLDFLFQDFTANRGRPTIQLLLVLFRLAQTARGRANSGPRRIAALPVLLLYRAYSLTVTSVDLPPSTVVGRRLAIHHGFGLVVNKHVIIGSNVVIRHGTTLGSRKSSEDCPTLGDGCDIGASCIVLGDITVGRLSQIGAGSVVLHDIPAGSVAVGSPARIVRSGPDVPA